MATPTLVAGAFGGVAGVALFKFGGEFADKYEIAMLAGAGVFVLIFALFSVCSGGAKQAGGKKKKKKGGKGDSQPATKDSAKEKKAAKKADKPKEVAPPTKKEKKAAEPAKKKEDKKKEDKKKEKEPKKPKIAKSILKIDSESDSDSEDDVPVKQAPAKKFVPESDSDDDAFLKIGGSNQTLSKSQARRKKANAKKAEQAAAAAVHASKTPTVDADGFQTHVIKRRARKAPGASAIPAAADSSLYENFDTPAEKPLTEEMAIEAKHFGVLIGPGGATLMKIQDACSVKINVPERDSEKRTVSIIGTKEAIADAKKHISNLLTKGFSAVTNPGINTAQVAVTDPKKLGIIIGPGGKNIKAIQEAFSVKINTPDRNSDSNKVTIVGDKEQVKGAKKCIQDLLEHGFSSVTDPGFCCKEVAFPREEFRTLIGPGGQTIKSIQGDTKTKVNIPDVKNPNQNVTVVGEVSGVDRAIKQISNLLAKKAAREAEELERSYRSEDSEDYDY